jgi:DNA processing protein
MDAADAYLRMAMVPGLGPVTAQRLMEAAGSVTGVFGFDMRALCDIRGVGGERARRITDPRLAERAEAERCRARQEGLRLLTPADDGYPRPFRDLPDPPLAIWMRGECLERDRLAITVVGPRRPTAYGHRQAHRFSTGLARIGATIVSGLARGIDTVVHRACLEAGGRTLGVLGSGFGHLYPAESAGLVAEIAAGRGAILSEYPWDTRPSAGTFPRRNRLVAALSLAVLVIEAGPRSGSLITARIGAELGREVMVIPGPIDRPEHQGANALIRDGATLVTSLEEVLEEVPPLLTLSRASPDETTTAPNPRINQRERQVYSLLGDQPQTVDDLHRVSQLPASAIGATLISLELRRLARKVPGGHVKAL